MSSTVIYNLTRQTIFECFTLQKIKELRWHCKLSDKHQNSSLTSPQAHLSSACPAAVLPLSPSKDQPNICELLPDFYFKKCMFFISHPQLIPLPHRSSFPPSPLVLNLPKSLAFSLQIDHLQNNVWIINQAAIPLKHST